MDRRTERRIAAASRELLQKERRISEILRLPMIPRLALLDEASVTYVTGDDRIRLDQEGAQGDQPKVEPLGGTQASDQPSTMGPGSIARGGWLRRRWRTS
jgi:hypothetical protein